MAYQDFFPRRVNMRVPLLQYIADGSLSPQQPYRVQFGAPLALSTTYFLNALQSVTGVALVASLANGLILNNGEVPDSKTSRWGRGLTFVASTTSTRTITLVGYDYLNQKMTWTGVLNGGTPVPVPKAFRWIESVTFGASADTVTVSMGYNNVLGLPYFTQMMIAEVKNDAVAANAGTLVAGVNGTATATSGDVRGTYTPATVIPDGTNTFDIDVRLRPTEMHGVAQFTS